MSNQFTNSLKCETLELRNMPAVMQVAPVVFAIDFEQAKPVELKGPVEEIASEDTQSVRPVSRKIEVVKIEIIGEALEAKVDRPAVVALDTVFAEDAWTPTQITNQTTDIDAADAMFASSRPLGRPTSQVKPIVAKGEIVLAAF